MQPADIALPKRNICKITGEELFSKENNVC